MRLTPPPAKHLKSRAPAASWRVRTPSERAQRERTTKPRVHSIAPVGSASGPSRNGGWEMKSADSQRPTRRQEGGVASPLLLHAGSWLASGFLAPAQGFRGRRERYGSPE